MRTVSFSNPQVQRLLNGNFVNTYTNTKGDPTAGMSIAHRPSDQPGQCIRGNGKQNVQTIFLTPEGEIFHVATGFLSGDDLLKEAKYAHELFQDLKLDSSEDAQIVVNAHRKRLLDSGFSDQEISNTNPMMAMTMFSPVGNMSLTQNSNGFVEPNFGRGQGVFDGFIKQQFLQDNQFPIRQPLMRWESLQSDPTPLVGNGKSFFASSASNSGR